LEPHGGKHVKGEFDKDAADQEGEKKASERVRLRVKTLPLLPWKRLSEIGLMRLLVWINGGWDASSDWEKAEIKFQKSVLFTDCVRLFTCLPTFPVSGTYNSPTCF
jgi:hypothetical protein